MHVRKLEIENVSLPFERVYESRDYYYLLLRFTRRRGNHFPPVARPQQPPSPCFGTAASWRRF